MNKYHIFSLASLVLGIVFFIMGFLTGDSEAGIFLIFPFISGSGVYPLLGFIFILIAIFLYPFGYMDKVTSFGSDGKIIDKKTSVKGGGIVLIGPIPIIFGSNWKITLVLMIVAIILIILLIFAFKII